jgi:hypothetical protein
MKRYDVKVSSKVLQCRSKSRSQKVTSAIYNPLLGFSIAQLNAILKLPKFTQIYVRTYRPTTRLHMNRDIGSLVQI